MRCEGHRKRGGIFSIGTPMWVQCESDAIVVAVVAEGKKRRKVPACLKCWNEAIATGVKIKSVTPLEAKP